MFDTIPGVSFQVSCTRKKGERKKKKKKNNNPPMPAQARMKKSEGCFLNTVNCIKSKLRASLHYS
jgi:hypothetical protein